ncbi:MFS transporter [Micromonospora avicenniae]|uniref:Drug resistance transporter, EmrB/QacA subfamily n=1 Tax=Micromonospora avicenniae TaxID=1198245 RepID=A0A1N6ZAD2_9ACTN|nr:MFS transporter [Micromonospora avicenniae]SIR23784.1 drug resistance transporter, EmrB/QacA subfamily [Micromonospora avicenniae]
MKTDIRPPVTTAQQTGALALALLAFVQFLVVLNTSIVNVALDAIAAQWRMSASGLSWVINAYLLPFGGLLLMGGRLGDLLGRRRVLLAGGVILGVGSLAATVAWSEPVLLAARALQGAGAALLAPTALAITVVMFAAQRQRALGIVGAVSGLGGAAGVLFSGVLTQTLGWRSIFALTAALALVTVAVTPSLVPRDVPVGDRRLDVTGGLLATLGVSALVYALSSGPRAGWGAPVPVAALAGGVALLVVFVAWQRRAADPLVRLGILRIGSVGPANALMLLLGAVWIGLFFYLPLLQQQVLGYGPLATGLSQLPLAGATVAASWLAPRVAARSGGRTSLVGALATLAAGLAWLGAASSNASFVADLLGPMLLIGAGLGLAFVVLTTLGLTGVDPAESGLASGLVNTTRQVGGGLGLALLTAAASIAATRNGQGGVEVLAEGFRWAFRTGFVIAALAALTALFTVPAGTARR